MRVGPHYQGHQGETGARLFRRWIDELRPTGAEFVAEGLQNDKIDYAKERGCTTFGRRVFDEREMTVSGSGHARLIDRVLERVPDHPNIDVWCSPLNEFGQTGTELARHADCDIDFMKAMEARGKKAAIGMFSLGTPDEAQLDLYWPALVRCVERGHWLARHEYAAPMQNGIGPNTNGQLLSAVNNWGKEEGWYVLRVVKFLREARKMGLDVDRLNIIIGESGNDMVMDPGQQPWPGRGYKDHRNAWWTRDPRFGTYPQQRYCIDRHYGHIKQVKVVVDYGFCSNLAKWGDFDMSTDEQTFNELMRLEVTLPRGHETMTDTGALANHAEAIRAARGININPASSFGKWIIDHPGWMQSTNEYTEAELGGAAVQLVQHNKTKARILLQWVPGLPYPRDVVEHNLDPQ